MSGDWEVEDSTVHGSDAMVQGMAEMLTAGWLGVEPDKTYTMKNKETGERKEVTAKNSQEAGKKVSYGDWD